MYFSGTIAVDPSELTHIIKVRPTRAFKRILYMLTAGGVSDKEEHETFCAVSILQQLNASLRGRKITNIIRLSKDDVDFYYDQEGKENDLRDALEAFQLEVDQVEARAFGALHMVLEHHEETMKYLIQIDVNRTHAVGVYPIVIKVNGMSSQFMVDSNNSEDVKKAMSGVFSNQESYDTFQLKQEHVFNGFMASLEMEIKKHIRVDHVTNDTLKKIVRPKKKVDTRGDLRYQNYGKDPIYHGYYGFSDALFYSFIWSELCFSNNIHLSDVAVLDDMGDTLMEVGAQGLDAGVGEAFDLSHDFAAPVSGDFSFPDDSPFSSSDSGGSWFDSLGDMGDFGGGDSGGGSSCSSCSSCGGCS